MFKVIGMNAILPFHEVLDAVDKLSGEEQDSLIAIVQKRRTEQARQGILDEVETSCQEHQNGQGKATLVEELMSKILGHRSPLPTKEERLKAWLAQTSQPRPLPFEADDSRESIYAESGE